MQPNLFTSASLATQFILAGKATVTLRSKKSGQHFTFRVSKPRDEDEHGNKKPDNGFRFVSLLNGPDNSVSYAYFGYLKPSQAGVMFVHGGAKAKVAVGAPGAAAFAWAWQRMAQGQLPEALEVWHEGKCGRCGRKLTHPESLESGFGPECIQKFECMAA